MNLWLMILFAVCGTGVVYAYALYPLIIFACSRVLGRNVQPPEQGDATLPPVSLLIAAHNEEAVIEERIRNALLTNYPKEQFEIVVSSDGSTDRTAEIVRQFEGVRLLDHTKRRGKSAVLNETIPQLAGEIVVLSDANTDLDPDAVRKLARWFAHPQVGAVCGRLELIDPETGRNADGLYWKYETFLKRAEAKLDALLGANGAIYALRKRIYVPIPDNTVVDDFVIPLIAKLKFGCLLRYDSDAIAREITPAAIGAEFKRRSRIGAGGFQSIGVLWRLLDPRRGWIAFTFFSHKVLRWLCPFFLIGALASSIALSAHPFFRAMLVAQLAFYVLSFAMSFTPPRVRMLKPLRLTTMFTSMNASLFVGFVRWITGTQRAAWQRTVRVAE